MKLTGRMLTLLLLLVVCLGGAYAQQSTRVIKVKIPFAFNVGDKAFPAGTYSLAQPLQHFIELRDARGHTVASSFTSGIDFATKGSEPRLRFENAGGQYVLAEFSYPADGVAQRLVGSKRAILMARRHSAESREAAEGSQP